MDKRKLTKTVVNHANSFAVSAVAGNFFRQYTKHSDNKALDITMNVATFVAAYSVSGTVLEPVKKHTDAGIDTFFDKIEAPKKPTPVK